MLSAANNEFEADHLSDRSSPSPDESHTTSQGWTTVNQQVERMDNYNWNFEDREDRRENDTNGESTTMYNGFGILIPNAQPASSSVEQETPSRAPTTSTTTDQPCHPDTDIPIYGLSPADTLMLAGNTDAIASETIFRLAHSVPMGELEKLIREQHPDSKIKQAALSNRLTRAVTRYVEVTGRDRKQVLDEMVGSQYANGWAKNGKKRRDEAWLKYVAKLEGKEVSDDEQEENGTEEAADDGYGESADPAPFRTIVPGALEPGAFVLPTSPEQEEARDPYRAHRGTYRQW